MLENTINLNEFIPISFSNNFYSYTSRLRKYSLNSMLWSLILQRIFSIPTDAILITFLKYYKQLRAFYGFTNVPVPSKFTRFKQDFLSNLQSMFNNFIDVTEPNCQSIDKAEACIPLNSYSKLKNEECLINEDGIPVTFVPTLFS